MSMRLLLAGGAGQGSGAGEDGFVDRIYSMSAADIAAFLSVERNKNLFFAAMSLPYPVVNLISHPDFASKICVNDTAVSLLISNSFAAKAIVANQLAMHSIASVSSAIKLVAASSSVTSDIVASQTASSVVLNSAVAFTEFAASATAMSRVYSNDQVFSKALANSVTLNILLKSAVARKAFVDSTLSNNLRPMAVFQSQKVAVFKALADTSKFQKVLRDHMQRADSQFGGSPPSWGNEKSAELIVHVKQAGPLNYGSYAAASWNSLEPGLESTGGFVREGTDYKYSALPDSQLCFGGIRFSKMNEAVIVVDAWRAI